jgi:hypothetical protein
MSFIVTMFCVKVSVSGDDVFAAAGFDETDSGFANCGVAGIDTAEVETTEGDATGDGNDAAGMDGLADGAAVFDGVAVKAASTSRTIRSISIA